MIVRLMQENDRERWDRYVVSSRISSCYHLTGWKDVIERSFGHATYYLLAEDGETIRGVLPLVRLKSVLFGHYLVSLPYFNYGGICADTDDGYRRLLKAASDIASSAKASYIEFRHTQKTGAGLPEKAAKVCMHLAAPGSPDDLWRSFPSKLRSQIGRPTREGLYAKIGGEEELDCFYTVFAENMRDLGTPVYSKRFFRNILRIFPESSRICSVYTRDGSPAASGFLVRFKERVEIPWASSLRRLNRFSPNMLLYWNALRYACEQGCRTFDFGRSTPGEGTYRFKEQWGAKPVPLYWHYWLRNGEPLPELNPKNPRYRLAIKIWKRLPVVITRLIGPAVVKNLP